MAGPSIQPPDVEARRRAVTDFDNNLVVIAGAGTGKTSLLVERLLNAIGGGRAEIDRLAAITFTEKAAAEMRQRVADGLEELRGLARGEPARGESSAAKRSFEFLHTQAGIAEADVARRALAALDGLDRAKVLTIHSFCSELLRVHPLEAGVDPGFSVDTGEQARVAGEAAWERFVSEELGPQAARPDLWARVLSDLALADVGKLAREMVGFGIPERIFRPPYLTPSAQELFADEARRLGGEIESLPLERLSAGDRRFLGAIGEAFAALAVEGLEACQRRFRADAALANKIEKGGGPLTRKLDGADAERLGNVHTRCRRMAKLLNGIDEPLTRSLTEALAPFAASFRETLLEQGWVSFDGLLVLARDLLRDFPEVRRELKRRYPMLLVDEFQDTDPLQYEIVLFLAEHEEDASPDPFAARLAPGRLFVVGDPKQSIYRFRGADYAAFRTAVRRIIDQGGTHLDLVANFRSVAGVTEPINALFGEDRSGCWTRSDYQPSYEPIRAVRTQADRSPRVDLWTLDLEGTANATTRRIAEGRLIAETVWKLVEIERACEYKKISILFRTFASIPHYLRPLRERGIPFVVDGGKDFLKRPEVAQSLAVLRTLAQPSDATALLAFLRSPAGGVSDAELAAYAAHGGRWHWREHPDTGRFARIADRFEFLQRLREETRQLPADAMIRRVVERAALLPLAAAAYEGAQRVANLQKLTAAAGQLARDGKLSLEDVVDALEEGGLADLESDSPLADDEAEAIRITSIHKMKGLENDWVLLPDLAREDRGTRREPLEVGVARTRAGPALGFRVARISNPAWVASELEKQRHERAEEVRVLYVALTRARERLVLIAAPCRKPGRWLRALSSWGYSVEEPPEDRTELFEGRVMHRIVRAEGVLETEAACAASRAEAAVREYDSAVAAHGELAVPPFRSPSALDEELEARRAAGENDSVPRAFAPSRDLAKAVGVVVHRLLESWDGGPDEALRGRLKRLSTELAREEQVEPKALEREARDVVERFLRSALARRLGEIETLGREVPLLLREANGASAYRGSIDLLYRDEEGRFVVADYKTDRETDEAALGKRYGRQLAIYREAVRQALGLEEPPLVELWHLRSGRRVPIEP